MVVAIILILWLLLGTIWGIAEILERAGDAGRYTSNFWDRVYGVCIDINEFAKPVFLIYSFLAIDYLIICAIIATYQ
jgi:hypothetical protein